MPGRIKKFFHHLLEPHCPICEEKKECQVCDVLREQLYVERENNRKLLDVITRAPEKTEEKEFDYEKVKPVKTWDAIRREKERKAFLEARRLQDNEDRDSQQALKEVSAETTVEQLEKELGVVNASD
jgi:hypothetical protein